LERQNIGAGFDGLFSVIAEIGVSGETHFNPIDLPGPGIELEETGIRAVFGGWIETGFAKDDVADDVSVDAVENPILIGKAGDFGG